MPRHAPGSPPSSGRWEPLEAPELPVDTGDAAAKRTPRLSGMRAFTLVCAGQTVSLLGTGMTGFALVLWAYLQTHSVTTLALAAFFRFAPTVILSPVAGALVDRWNRKLTMMLSDLAAGIGAVVLLLLYLPGFLQVRHWYVVGAVSGAFQAVQWPADSAAGSASVPHRQKRVHPRRGELRGRCWRGCRGTRAERVGRAEAAGPWRPRRDGDLRGPRGILDGRRAGDYGLGHRCVLLLLHPPLHKR